MQRWSSSTTTDHSTHSSAPPPEPTTTTTVLNTTTSTTTSTPPHSASSYKVARVGIDGTMVMKSLLLSEILKKSPNIYARDLFSLALTTKQERHKRTLRRPVSAILPRGDEILVSFGNLRAMMSRTFVIFFDAHTIQTRQFARNVATVMASPPYPNDTVPEPFELVILEEILQDTCDGFNRRIQLYEPIVDSFLHKVSNEVFSDSGVHLLPPLKDSLQSFEMQVRLSRDCLTELLGSDEDMIGLLLTEQHDAKTKGLAVPPSRHENVELLLEEYARQLNNTLFDIQLLLKRLQSKQEFVSLALSGYRNRMIRMNLYLGITGLTFGMGATVAGIFGMNLNNGFENHPYMFQTVVISTALVGLSVFGGCMRYVSGKTMQKRAAQRLFEIETLNGALSDMCALDFTVKKMLDTGESMSKEEFRTNLKKARLSGKVTDAEVDLLFGVMDSQKDGILQNDDFLALSKRALSPKDKRWRIS